MARRPGRPAKAVHTPHAPKPHAPKPELAGAKVRFVGAEDTCEIDGRTFHKGHWDAEHRLSDHWLALLSGNPTFEVHGYDGPPVADPVHETAPEPLDPIGAVAEA